MSEISINKVLNKKILQAFSLDCEKTCVEFQEYLQHI